MSLSLWGNDTAAHLTEGQTMAGKGAIVPNLYFSLIWELGIGCFFLARNRHAMAQNLSSNSTLSACLKCV